MKLIGIEEHFLTTEVRDAWAAIGLEATDPHACVLGCFVVGYSRR